MLELTVGAVLTFGLRCLGDDWVSSRWHSGLAVNLGEARQDRSADEGVPCVECPARSTTVHYHYLLGVPAPTDGR